MTATTVATGSARRGPVRVRDVLRPARRGPDEAGAAALRGAQRPNRWRAGATGALIAAEAVKAVDEDLGTLLVGALEKKDALGEAAQQSRADPGHPVLVDLTEIEPIPASVTAELDVYVHRLHRATVTAVLEVEFGLLGVGVVVQDGSVTGVYGQQSVTAKVKVESIRFTGGRLVQFDDCTLAETGRQTDWAPVPLSHPVPLRGRDEPG